MVVRGVFAGGGKAWGAQKKKAARNCSRAASENLLSGLLVRGILRFSAGLGGAALGAAVVTL